MRNRGIVFFFNGKRHFSGGKSLRVDPAREAPQVGSYRTLLAYPFVLYNMICCLAMHCNGGPE